MPQRDQVAEAIGRAVAELSSGEVREGQLEMAHAIERAIDKGRHVTIRAGTGTGKSLGYLVPAVLSKRKVVIATATKALQDQLANNDLPLVAKSIGVDFSYEVLKGRANYLCAQRLVENETLGQQGAFDDDGGTPSKRFGDDIERILKWSKKTTTGDRSELAEEPDPRVWASFSVGSDECPGAQRCPSGDRCFAEAARSRASEAEITVVNLHLLGADLANGGAILPEHDVLVVDEAHELEAVLSASLGTSFSGARLRSLAAMARRTLGARTGPSAERAAAVDDANADLIEVANRLDEALVQKVGERLHSPFPEEFAAIIELCRTRLERFESSLRGPSSDDTESQSTARALLLSGRLREVISSLQTIDDDSVAWVEGTTRPVILVAPIDVSGVLEDQVFSKGTVVLTSATVPTGLATQLGADGNLVEELDIASPFDFENHALLYCAAHLPDRRSPQADEMVCDELTALIEAAGGRTLALFTSWAAMRRSADAVRARVSFPIFVQGEHTKTALMEKFQADHEACLFATMSFWQGIDAPGATLSLVVIDRLPFARPDDPLLAARRERAGREAFRVIDLPRAASLLAQGAGRLIRGVDDKGVVAVLDSRLATASYRWQLVRALPPMRRTKDREVASAFLRDLRSSPELLKALSSRSARLHQADAASRARRAL